MLVTFLLATLYLSECCCYFASSTELPSKSSCIQVGIEIVCASVDRAQLLSSTFCG